MNSGIKDIIDNAPEEDEPVWLTPILKLAEPCGAFVHQTNNVLYVQAPDGYFWKANEDPELKIKLMEDPRWENCVNEEAQKVCEDMGKGLRLVTDYERPEVESSMGEPWKAEKGAPKEIKVGE